MLVAEKSIEEWCSLQSPNKQIETLINRKLLTLLILSPSPLTLTFSSSCSVLSAGCISIKQADLNTRIGMKTLVLHCLKKQVFGKPQLL